MQALEKDMDKIAEENDKLRSELDDEKVVDLDKYTYNSYSYM